jgi:formylglycine-generating enzyme required for sulfatase activity
MARIFISYSRVDRRFVEALADKLRRIYGHDNVWFDEGLHGGDIWWEEILEQVAARDIFIYVLSNDSVQSDYCQAEFTEARRLQKQIITVQARDRTRLTDELGDIHYINMANGVDDADGALTDLYRSVNKRMTKVPKRTPKPLWEPVTPRPGKVDEKPRPTDAPDVDTPTLEVPRAERENVRVDNKPWWKEQKFIIGAILILLIVGSGLFAFNLFSPRPGGEGQGVRATDTTEVAQIASDNSPNDINADDARATGAAQAYATLTALAPTETPTITLTPTDTPISSSDIQQTAQAEIFATETYMAQTQAVIAQETQSAVLTEQFSAGSTATYIVQLSLTAPATNTPEAPTATLTPDMPEAERVALQDVTSNTEWESLVGEGGYVREFNGVEMVLVPAGCFVMGNDRDAYFWNGSNYVQNVPDGDQQCFDEPFWVDKTEVTQADFDRLGGEQADPPAFDGASRPIEDITWFEARDFCVLRGGRLPTEAEWEYVARGPDELYFPWGNDWNTNNAVWNRSSSQGTADVGSILAGASWVGALDMSGNVWEWTRSVYLDYPYVVSDGREADLDDETDVRYPLRGGSWYDTEYESLRSATRNWFFPNYWDFSFGFRCVLSYE